MVLLQRSENAKFAQGMWDLPVGKSEPGEPITDTAVRELYEETGLTVQPESLRVAHIIHGAWGVEAPGGFLTVVLAAHNWTGEPENREPRKPAQVCWVDTDAIPAPFVDTTVSALDRYLGGGPDVSLNGWEQWRPADSCAEDRPVMAQSRGSAIPSPLTRRHSSAPPAPQRGGGADVARRVRPGRRQRRWPRRCRRRLGRGRR